MWISYYSIYIVNWNFLSNQSEAGHNVLFLDNQLNVLLYFVLLLFYFLYTVYAAYKDYLHTVKGYHAKTHWNFMVAGL